MKLHICHGMDLVYLSVLYSLWMLVFNNYLPNQDWPNRGWHPVCMYILNYLSIYLGLFKLRRTPCKIFIYLCKLHWFPKFWNLETLDTYTQRMFPNSLCLNLSTSIIYLSRIDQIEDDTLYEKLKIKAISDDLDGTFTQMAHM